MTTRSSPLSSRRRSILILAFAVYLVLLAWVVLWKLDVPWVGDAAALWRPLKLVPFMASGDAGASAPTEVLINVVIFVPFGLFLGALVPMWTWWQTGGTILGASFALEVVQHLISTGNFDTTDLIVNTAGGLVGYGIFAILRVRDHHSARAGCCRGVRRVAAAIRSTARRRRGAASITGSVVG